LKSEISLSPRELLYIAALLDATEFMGISDAFFGMDDEEIGQEVTMLQTSLEAKGYAQPDFDGGFTIKEDVLEIVDICANCDTFVVVDKNKVDKPQLRALYYAKSGNIVMLKEDKGANILIPISGVDSLLAHIMKDIQWQSSVEASIQSVTISSAILSEAKAEASGFDSSKGVEVLMQSGCDELSATMIMDGLSGKTNYYSVIITVFEGEREGVYNTMLIDTPNGIYKLASITDGDEDTVQFDPITVEQAQTILSDLVGCVLPRESEGFS